ncbi:hypothetical protein PV762_25905 [Mitsuaria sp. CC2]|uniref:hypothetical protein n=1 Tax=Mitsuaria sp. CC2 TaxID=3029186 RepID=UPI003B8C3717
MVSRAGGAFIDLPENYHGTNTPSMAPSLAVFDRRGDSIPTFDAAPRYSYSVGPGIKDTGAALETSARLFVRDSVGNSLIVTFDTKIPGNQGFDLAYVKMVDGNPVLVIGEAKSSNSALTAFGENSIKTLNRNIDKLSFEIDKIADASMRQALREQLERKTYEVELYVGPDVAAGAASRFSDTLVSRVGVKPTRIVTFKKAGGG